MDLAGKEHWERTWTGGDLPGAVDPARGGIWNHIHRRFHAWLQSTLADVAPGSQLLEIGCARSPWLPYFAKQFGFRVTGLDYSPIGAAKARAVLAREGVAGEIIQGDLFAPPVSMLGSYDVVVSFGVMEHFSETSVALKAAAAFLRPGGLLITEVPNLVGIVGRLQKAAYRPIYDIHVPIDRASLEAANERAGLTVLKSDYLIVTQFGMLNFTGMPDGRRRRMVLRAVYGLQVLSAAVWWLDEHIHLAATPSTAGYLISAARKPA